MVQYDHSTVSRKKNGMYINITKNLAISRPLPQPTIGGLKWANAEMIYLNVMTLTTLQAPLIVSLISQVLILLFLFLSACKHIYKALRYHMRIVFEEMSSWTPLSMHLGIKTTFQTKHIKATMFRFLS